MTITERFRQIHELAQQPGIVAAAAILEDVVEQMRLASMNQANIAADRIAQMLMPERHNRPRPAAAVVTIEAESMLSIDTEAEFKASVGGNEYTFTPVYPTTVYPLSMQCIGFGQSCYDMSGEGLPQKLALDNALPHGLFLLGFQQKVGGIDQVEGLQILFQHLDKETIKLLPWAKLYYKGRVYRLAAADFPEYEEELTNTVCDKEFLLLDHLRRNIAKATTQQALFRLVEVKDKYVIDSFEPSDYGLDLAEKMQPLEWAQLVLPEGLDVGKLARVSVKLNAFPVFNAYSSIKDESWENSDDKTRKTVSIPVDANENFLALGRVWTHADSPYLPEEFSPLAKEGAYVLSLRNPAYLANLDIIGLVHTLQSSLQSTNPAALASLARNNRDALQPFTQSLNTIAKEWATVSAGLPRISHEHYLTIKPAIGEKVVYIEIWRTNTGLADTLLPAHLNMKHAIPNCGVVQMQIPPDKIKYNDTNKDTNSQSYLTHIFPEISNRYL